MAKAKDKAVAVIGFNEYAVIKAGGAGAVTELIAENMGGESIEMNDLNRVKVPAGGGTIWTLPSIDGELDVKEIDGIIIYQELKRAYWQEEYDGSNDPPDCYSDNCLNGLGSPGGDCITCPLAQFGSGKNGKSQACGMRRIMFILTADSLLPLVLSLPAGSLKTSKGYMLALTGAQKKINGVITRFTLEKDKNSDNIVFSKVNFAKIDDVSDVVQIEAYCKSIRPFLQKIASKAIQTGDGPAQDVAAAPDYDPDSVPGAETDIEDNDKTADQGTDDNEQKFAA